MESYPSHISNYLHQYFVEARHPGYLYVGQDCQVIDAGGALAYYGLHSYEKGQCIKEGVCFLHDLLPLDGEPIVIPLVQFQEMHFADLHLIPGESGDWVLLLDATEEAIQQQRTQQLAYHQKWIQEIISSSWS